MVTTGGFWKCLRLSEALVGVDPTEYSIRDPEQILGILVGMVRQAAGAMLSETGP